MMTLRRMESMNAWKFRGWRFRSCEWRLWVFLSVLWNPNPSISHPIYLFSVAFLPPRETPDISLSGSALKSLWFFNSVAENMEGHLTGWPGCLHSSLVPIHSDSRAVLMASVAFGWSICSTDLHPEQQKVKSGMAQGAVSQPASCL